MKPIVLTTAGEYSDFSVLGIFFWLSEKQPRELLAEWRTLRGAELEFGSGEESKFVGWLHQIGAVEDVPFQEMYLGDYGLKEDGLPTIGVASISERAEYETARERSK